MATRGTSDKAGNRVATPSANDRYCRGEFSMNDASGGTYGVDC
jgi:hypothetical protein